MKMKVKVRRHGEFSDRYFTMDMKVRSTSNTFIADLARAVDNVVKMHFPDMTSADDGQNDPSRNATYVRESSKG